jgi:hypothetical protein
MSYIGIDPGKQGGLVLIGDDGGVGYSVMPATDLDLWRWFQAWNLEGAVAVIEKVHAFPAQGRSSCFEFGRGYGALRMALTAACIPFETVGPRVWQPAVGVPSKKGEPKKAHKERLRAKAQELFPSLLIWTEPHTKEKQLAIADALLIAWYCRRLNH